MEPIKVPKSFGCFPFPHSCLRINLRPNRPSKSTPTSSSLSSLKSIATSKSASMIQDELREVFRRFDGDGDGMISAIELRSYFASIGEYMSHEDAQIVIDDVDTDGDNLIDFGDFVKLMKREGRDDDEDLKAAFGIFEVEKGSGRINPKSLQRVLGRLGDSRTYDECAAMIQAFDVDGSGELDFHEFQQMMAA